MAKILVIGGGAMGSAFTIPCLDNKNNVTITEPYSKQFINNLKSKNKFHSVLKIKLPKKLKFRIFSKELLKEKFNLIVIALSLPGINFISKELKNIKNKTPILILTKGLKYDKKRNKILTISEQIKISTKNKNISVLKGPCLAKELATKNQTKVIIANKNIKIARLIGLEKKTREAKTQDELNFVVANETRQIIDYINSFLLLKAPTDKFQVKATSDLATVDRTAPLITFIENIINESGHNFKEIQNLDVDKISKKIKVKKPKNLPDNILCIPILRPQKGLQGYLILSRNEKFIENEIELSRHLSLTLSLIHI